MAMELASVTFPASSYAQAPVAAETALPDSLYPPLDKVVATHNEWTRGNYPKMIKEFKANPLHMHDIVFLGNSITRQGRDWSKRLGMSGIANRGIAGDVTDGVLQRLDEIVYIQPRAVFLEIGVNDLFNSELSPERTADNIVAIIKTLHAKCPETRLFVQTVFPTQRDSMVKRIRETNAGIRKKLPKKICTIIETHVLFADSADHMQAAYTNDGVHLTEKGYEVWVEELKKYLSQWQ
ncbi:GDSL-type esterase/lipase family protein [Filimonas lacunae]|nr:GDSL-type esterase/lipase family protein [Filimonas lacunae]BAV07567.1 beta-lactamase [Filimonas lacunae]